MMYCLIQGAVLPVLLLDPEQVKERQIRQDEKERQYSSLGSTAVLGAP